MYFQKQDQEHYQKTEFRIFCIELYGAASGRVINAKRQAVIKIVTNLTSHNVGKSININRETGATRPIQGEVPIHILNSDIADEHVLKHAGFSSFETRVRVHTGGVQSSPFHRHRDALRLVETRQPKTWNPFLLATHQVVQNHEIKFASQVHNCQLESIQKD